MKIARRIAALSAAAAVAVSSVNASAVSISDLIGYFTSGTTDEEQIPAQTYVSPMTTNHKAARYKKFTETKPVVRQSDDYYYGIDITWKPVKDALLYYIYKSDGDQFRMIDRTTDTVYYCENEGTYFIRAVTYDFNDKRILGAASDTISVKYSNWWYDDEDYDWVDGGYAEKNYSNSVPAAAEAEAYYETDEAETGAIAGPDLSAVSGITADGWYPQNAEEYSKYAVDGFKKAAQTPLSTFSADVDTASYANVRRMVLSGNSVTPDAVRIEEFLNYFDYDYVQPTKGNFSVTYEYTDCPWNDEAKLLMLGIQAKDVESEPNSNLVFLVDVSGSMYSRDKLPLVVESLKKLTAEMSSKDRISIVTYSGQEKVVVAGARGNMRNCIGELADTLVASGCTNGEAGINMAYNIAARYYIKGGSNRVILATDGDLNVGISNKDELSEFISKKRETGIYLTVLGFGTGNIKDNKMEALAQDGNGNYHYIDCAEEATKVLVDERKATLITVADDVKLQVEFNPALVESYRLIGYDGRRLANEDFENDAKDAADLGAGQSVTVMYEIIPAKDGTGTLTYQTTNGNKEDICTLSCRYKTPGESKSKAFSVAVKAKNYCKYEETGARFKFAACVTETAMALRKESSYGDVSVKAAKARFDQISDNDLAQIGYSDDFASLLANLS